MENDTTQNLYSDEKELLGSYYATLNPTLQNIITSEETVGIVNTVADENNLTEEEADTFGNEVQLALLGFGNPINFAENLIKEGVRAEKASLLASAAEEKIFSQVKTALQDLYAETPVAEPEPVVETPPTEEASVVIPTASTQASTPEPVPQTPPAVAPFINTQSVRTETTHTLDREALLRELESPEPFNVPFTPRKTSFEEKMNPVAPVPPAQTIVTPPIISKPTQHMGGDPYREEPLS
jgi:hypothetical protein